MNKIVPHPIAELFPPMTNEEFANLVDDISQVGLQNPICIYEGKILDGRHRYRACLKAGVEIRIAEYKGKDPSGFVISRNLRRRNLSSSQSSMVAAKLANLKSGQHKTVQKEDSSANLQSTSDAAKKVGVSPRSVATAKKVITESPALAAQVESGTITLNAASKQIAQNKAKAAQPVRLDKKEYPIPPKIVDLWDRAEDESKQAMRLVTVLRTNFNGAKESCDIIYRDFHFKNVESLLSNLWTEIKLVAPYSVCTLCQGMLPVSCKFCQGRGFINQMAYDQFADSGVKAVREKANKK